MENISSDDLLPCGAVDRLMEGSLRGYSLTMMEAAALEEYPLKKGPRDEKAAETGSHRLEEDDALSVREVNGCEQMMRFCEVKCL